MVLTLPRDAGDGDPSSALEDHVGLAASARTGLTGRTLMEIDGPIDLVVAPLGLFFMWLLWLAARLWRRTLSSPA